MMEIFIGTDGTVSCLYGDAFPLREIGLPRITRASHVEPDETGRWWCNLSPVGGPTLGPYPLRRDALAAEVGWLRLHVIGTILVAS